jgi:hypothetical protein
MIRRAIDESKCWAVILIIQIAIYEHALYGHWSILKPSCPGVIRGQRGGRGRKLPAMSCVISYSGIFMFCFPTSFMFES